MFSKNEQKILINAKYLTETYLKYQKWSLTSATAATSSTVTSVKYSDQQQQQQPYSSSWIKDTSIVHNVLNECVKILEEPTAPRINHLPLTTSTSTSIFEINRKGEKATTKSTITRDLNQVLSLHGWHPIHLGSLIGDNTIIEKLIQLEPSSINKIYYQDKTTIITPLICAVLAGHYDTLQLLLKNNADPKLYPETLVNWSIKGGNVKCCRYLLMELHLIKRATLNLCHLMENGILNVNSEDLLQLIFEHDNSRAVVFQKNALGDTTLMLAIEKGLYNCAKSLLKEKVPVNQTNNEGKTAIHKAIYCSLSDEIAIKFLNLLLTNSANQLRTDLNGLSALRYASYKGYSNCVFKLIEHGALITVEDLAKLNERIPNFIETHLNSLVSMRGITKSNSKILVGINLKFTGTINSPLKNLRETSFINFLIEDGQRNFLNHPTIETFLTVKWIFVRKYFILSTLFYLLLVIFFTFFIIEAYVNVTNIDSPTSILNSDTNSTNTTYQEESYRPSSILLIFKYLSITSIVIRIIYITLIILILNPEVYFLRLINWLHLFILVTMIISHINLNSKLGTNQIPDWQNKMAALAVLLTWMYCLNYIRREPHFGIYVEMLLTVFTNILKFLLTYTCLLIGFAISFMVLYRKKPPFTNLMQSISRVLNMMVGEMSYEALFTTPPTDNNNQQKASSPETAALTSTNHEHELIPITQNDYMTYMFYTFFIVTVTIALINLLIGLAVSDIKGLRKRSKLHKLMREVAFITDLEDCFHSTKLQQILHPKIYKYLQESLYLQSTRKLDILRWSPDMTQIFIYPNDSNDKRLQKELKMEALSIAVQNKLAEDRKNKLICTGGATTTRIDSAMIEDQLQNIQSQLQMLTKKFKRL